MAVVAPPTVVLEKAGNRRRTGLARAIHGRLTAPKVEEGVPEEEHLAPVEGATGTKVQEGERVSQSPKPMRMHETFSAPQLRRESVGSASSSGVSSNEVLPPVREVREWPGIEMAPMLEDDDEEEGRLSAGGECCEKVRRRPASDEDDAEMDGTAMVERRRSVSCVNLTKMAPLADVWFVPLCPKSVARMENLRRVGMEVAMGAEAAKVCERCRAELVLGGDEKAPVRAGESGRSSTLNGSGGVEERMAASALHPITIADARKRNLLVGSNGQGGQSLVGVEALRRHFPDGRARVFAATWNLGGATPEARSLRDWLLPDEGDDEAVMADVYAVAVQEGPTTLNDWTKWEILLQEVIGPSHVLYHSVWMGAQHCAVFFRRELIWFIRDLDDAVIGTRMVNVAKAKGACAIAFRFFGTSFLFVASHLTAHDEKVNERIADYWQIVRGLKFARFGRRSKRALSDRTGETASDSYDVTAHFDVVLWAGDLNFRIDMRREEAVKLASELLQRKQKATPMPAERFEGLLAQDQLAKCARRGNVFGGFREGVIRFAPSYKFERRSVEFDKSSKCRVPSYTDRILFRAPPHAVDAVVPESYQCVHSAGDSDHKPVFACLSIRLKPGRDKFSRFAAWFKHEIYLKGMLKRSEGAGEKMAVPAGKKMRTKSRMCAIQ